MKYLVNVPPDRQQFIDPPLALLALGVPMDFPKDEVLTLLAWMRGKGIS